MSAFVSGAVSALKRCLNLISILDPNGEDINLTDMKNQINLYISMYKTIDEVNSQNTIKDETWEKIKEASEAPEEVEQIKKIFFDA